jgi:site-specific recombinase XerD
VIVTPAEALASVARPPAARGRPTLSQLAQAFLRWLEAHHRPETTIASYGDGLGAFLTYAHGVGMEYPDQVTVLSLDGYYVWLRARGKSAATMSHRRSVLISFWKWLEHEGFADRNIPAKTYPIKTPKRIPVYLEPHQIDAFLAKLAALEDLAGQRDHAVVATFFYTGLRVSELATLRLVDVDVVGARIRVNLGKGGKDRIVYVPPRLRPILQRYLDHVRPALVARLTEHAAHGAWLFVKAARARRPRRGGVEDCDLVTRAWYQVIFRRARALLGVKLSPHKLRHTCATYLLYHGAQLETIQRLLGHADVRTTMIYLHTPQKRQEEEIGRIFG